ncbi:hypothetical protein ACIRPH_30055 [Nocardiopsis sp. NPDC101807]|uniref:hypothetical protein n=1 Tax=Nocardiopsis sp. NPDC101807 TaxID=3364339 RepID=UPI0037F76ABC
MSVRMMVEVLDRAPRELPDVQHRALVAMAERMNDCTRTGFHPLDELAHRISRSRSTATRTLRALTDRGLLKVVSKAGRGKATVYFMPPLPADGAQSDDHLSPDAPEATGKGVTQDADLSDTDGTGKDVTQDDDLSGEGEPQRSSSEAERSAPTEERSANQGRKHVTQDADPSPHPSDIPHHPRVRADRPASASADAATDDDEELRSLEDDPAAAAAMVALRHHTRRTITADHARAVARAILTGRTVKDPPAYVRSAVDRDPDRHLPAVSYGSVADVTRRPDGTTAKPRRTDERPVDISKQFAALRTQWERSSRERQAEERSRPTAFADLINPKE